MPQLFVILAVGALVIGYCTIGGNWAVMANDFVQGLIMVSVTVLITILCFNYAGGVGEFFSAMANSTHVDDLRFVSPLPKGKGFLEAPYGRSWLVVTFMVQFCSMVSMFQGVRFFSAKDGREAAKAAYLAAGLMVVGCVVFFIPPIFSRLFLFEEVMSMHTDPAKASEFSFAVASRYLLPKGAFSLMLVSMLAAAISSLDTGLNRNSALIVRDLLPALLRSLGLKPIRVEREVFAGKMATVGLGCMIVLVALFYSQMRGVTLFDLMLSIANMLMLPQFIPLVLFLFIRKMPAWSALASMVAGFLPSVLNMALGWGWSYQEKSLAIVTCSSAVFFISMAFYRRISDDERERVEAFYENMTTPIDYAKEVGQNSDVFQLRQIGLFSLLLGSLTMLLLFMDNPLSGRLCIAAIGGFVISVGLLMFWLSKRRARQND